ncbi:MAG: hypothetical protein JXX29_16650 [Deltaproteobacteria bacterium]|nr:hypothetical protein [Deltaproteobacteria bacterium]MBN2673315.1 hypothetical protein [Deltaproteobacteria bacterium]
MSVSMNKKIQKRRGERGFVLIIVLLLIIMISGLGLLAVRHTQQEARATGAYADSTQAVALVESGMAVAITDLRAAPDYYRVMFSDPSAANVGAANDIWNAEIAIPLSGSFYSSGSTSACATGQPWSTVGCIGDLTNMDDGNYAAYRTVITYNLPLVGPCPPGYSCFDEQNYGWYVFGVNVDAQFGTAPSFWDRRFVVNARAQGAGRVTIGPIGAYGN